MVKKLVIFPLVVAFLMLSLAPGLAQADGWKKGRGYDKGLDEKIYFKAGFLMMNQEELGLSEKQVDQIKAIKMATKRELVKRDAEIDLVKLDIKEKMYEDKIDPAAIDPLIDRKYDLKKARAKYLVKQYAALKGVLTDEQQEKMRSVWRSHCKKQGKG